MPGGPHLEKLSTKLFLGADTICGVPSEEGLRTFDNSKRVNSKLARLSTGLCSWLTTEHNTKLEHASDQSQTKL